MNKRVWLVVYLVFCFILLGFSFSKAQVLEGKVINIIDGNTFEFEGEDGYVQKLILWGADCPELDQLFGKEAQQYLSDKILKKKITVDIKGRDRKGVKLVMVTRKNEPINAQVVSEGYAWSERMYSRGIFDNEQNKAQNMKLGLWQNDDPVSPEIFRRQQSMNTAKSR